MTIREFFIRLQLCKLIGPRAQRLILNYIENYQRVPALNELKKAFKVVLYGIRSFHLKQWPFFKKIFLIIR